MSGNGALGNLNLVVLAPPASWVACNLQGGESRGNRLLLELGNKSRVLRTLVLAGAGRELANLPVGSSLSKLKHRAVLRRGSLPRLVKVKLRTPSNRGNPPS